MKHIDILTQIPPLTFPESRPMSDRDWENYVLQREREEADFFNSTALLMEKPHVR